MSDVSLFYRAMGFGGAGFQPVPTVAPQQGEAFRAKWHSALKPWLICRFLNFIAYFSPIGFIVCCIMKVPLQSI